MEESLSKFVVDNPWLIYIGGLITLYILKEMREDYKVKLNKREEQNDTLITSLNTATRSIDHLTINLKHLEETLTDMKVEQKRQGRDIGDLTGRLVALEEHLKEE